MFSIARLMQGRAPRAHALAMALIRRGPGWGGQDWRELSRKPVVKWDRETQGVVTVMVERRRAPPLPDYGPGLCPVCGLKAFSGGHWSARRGPGRKNLQWHQPCLTAWTLWTQPDRFARQIAAAQDFTCPETHTSLYVLTYPEWSPGTVTRALEVEVDHRVPLWRVWAEHERHTWPGVLDFWGWPNLQGLSPKGHKLKTAREAAERAKLRRAA